MNYVIGGAVVALCILGLYVWVICFKTKFIRADCKALKEAKEKLNKKIEEEQQTLKCLNDQQQAIVNKTVIEQQKYDIATQRAVEAQRSTDRLLLSELGRARAELQRMKEVEEQKIKHDLEQKEKIYKEQHEFKCQQFTDDFNELSENYNNELRVIQQELNEYQAKREAVNKAILRERELEEKEDFYRIAIRDTDARDIEVMRSIESHLFNKEILNKLIYETFIKRPLMEMEKRVLGGRRVGGIYKITYIKTGESYIGRSVDIGNRWKEHCLSSLNIGTIAHSTFHNVLADKGLQNFTWEVLEEVDKEKQSSREKYWIEFYQTDKQYNQKAGG